MIIKTFNHTNKDVLDKPIREAARAVIIEDKKILLVHLEKTNEYKFPGGGVETNESLIDALKREVLEESGKEVIESSYIGLIDQYYPDLYDLGKVFSMNSHYFFAKISNINSELNLSKSESELGFKPVFIDIDEAINVNQLCLNNDSKYHWTERELYMLKYLKENYNERFWKSQRVWKHWVWTS